MIGATARVRVPASSSNLGAGFDCIGIAVDRWLEAEVSIPDDVPAGAPKPVTIFRGKMLNDLTGPDAQDHLYTGFVAACRAARAPVPAYVAIRAESRIPVSRGLGSSSAAYIAGAMLANDALRLGLDQHAIAILAGRLEGHPDNVAPAVFGGGVLSVRAGAAGRDAEWVFAPLAIHESIAFAFAVPPFPVKTAEARAVLPREVPHQLAVEAAAKSAALVAGLASGDPALLRAALDDVLHVPFRRGLIQGLSPVVDTAVHAGAFGATISGSGSTLVAVAPAEIAEGVAQAMRNAWLSTGVGADVFVQRRPASGASLA